MGFFAEFNDICQPKLKRSETTLGNETSVLLYQTFLKYVDPICFQESLDAS